MLDNEHKVPILAAPSQQQGKNNEYCRRCLGRLQKLLHLKRLMLFSYEDMSHTDQIALY